MAVTGWLAALGLLVLIGDVQGDLAFFAVAERRETSLMLAAALRNLVTVAAVAALFLKRREAVYLLLAAAVLGLWRRGSYLLPLVSVQAAPQDWMLYVSGLDTGFRMMLLGFAAGLLAQGSRQAES